MQASLRKLGKIFVEVFLKLLGGFIYLFVLITPGMLIEDEVLVCTWVVFALLTTLYLGVLYKIADEKDKTLPYFQRIKASVPETNRKFFWGIGIFTAIIIFVIWVEEDSNSVPSTTNIPSTYTPPATTYRPTTYTAPPRTYTAPAVHYDDDYEYNYRTGNSGNYGYNYDIEGYSDSGDYFYGEVDTSGKYGDGYIYDENGNEVYVETEWADYGVLEATDENGNVYEFEVD